MVTFTAAAAAAAKVGSYRTLVQRVESSSVPSAPPPKSLLIASRSEAGDFPILIFLHGYLLFNSSYSHLIEHVASHGFIVIAPQILMGYYRDSGIVSYCLCKSGKSREPMRKFVGGIVVAFMKAYLNGDESDLIALRDGVETPPVEHQTVEFLP